MPRDKDRKRLVRARMQKTGESYTAALSHLRRKAAPALKKPAAPAKAPPPPDLATLAGMSDESVKRATGCNWSRWVEWLDRKGAVEMKHPEIVKLIAASFDIGSWWNQMVTVGYERIRGLREKGAQRDGTCEVNKSKTVNVSIADAYRAFAIKRNRLRWLDVDVTVRKSTSRTSVRWTLPDGAPVEVYFWEKGPAKTQVQLQQRKVPNKTVAGEVRAAWTARLDALVRHLTE